MHNTLDWISLFNIPEDEFYLPWVPLRKHQSMVIEAFKLNQYSQKLEHVARLTKRCPKKGYQRFFNTAHKSVGLYGDGLNWIKHFPIKNKKQCALMCKQAGLLCMKIDDYCSKLEMCGGRYKSESLGLCRSIHENGKLVWYYENGNIKEKGSFKNGEKHGRWVHYKDNSIEQGHFKNRLKHGKWSYYHENGHIEATGKYKIKISEYQNVENSSIRYGQWVFYDESGKVRSKKSY